MKLHHGEGHERIRKRAVRWMKPLMQEPFAETRHPLLCLGFSERV